ncbi:MAG: PolC-type DNA polymerase III [Ruminococcaceae bacterium]|nr:PolC-type DNA polymerase III [Oscillospiraceae bacterium]
MASLTEKFTKYTPNNENREWLSKASILSLRADKARRIVEVTAAIPSLIEKSRLYNVENEICQVYEYNVVKILPKYPSELFSYDYVPQILLEAENIGIVARGFFGYYTYTLDDHKLTIEIPFTVNGIKFVCDAKTPEIIENIIKSEFSIDIKVEIRQSAEESPQKYGIYKTELEYFDRELSRASMEYDKRAKEPAETVEKTPVEEDPLDHVSSIYDTDAEITKTENIIEIGTCRFDISEPEYLIGEPFALAPIPICTVDDGKSHANVTLIGRVEKFTADPTRSGDNLNVLFTLFDGNSSIECKAFLDKDEFNELKSAVSVGSSYVMNGYTKYEMRKRGKERERDDEPTFHYTAIAKISKIERMDNAEKKRVELHLHTQMSAMDAIIPPDKAVALAKKWGMPAVAITDHGNVQGYPEAMLAAEKLGMKVIYGMEAYFVNDTQSALFGSYDGVFTDEMVVFDIETTGLSNKHNKIIEIGAVRIKDGKVLEKFDEFINPGEPISKEITKLTSITNEMVKEADPLEPVLRRFFDFIGDKLLIAHNASFDTGFIRVAARECGIEFKNPFLDTLTLSRFLNTDLKSHKLDRLAEYYNLGDFHHHRASDDAEILAHIYFSMVEKLQKYNLSSFNDLNREMSVNSDPLKLPTYHQIILVKNKEGLKNLYKLISMSYLNYYRKHPRIPKSALEQHREGLIIGSACESGELYRAILEGLPESDIESIVSFNDYLEIQPLSNNMFLVNEGKLSSVEDIKEINKKIIELGKKYKKPVVATCDAHFINDEDEIFRKILLKGMKFRDADKDTHIYFRTTEEMLQEFAYLGEETAYEVVVENTNLIADMIEPDVRPIPKGTYTPKMEGAEEELQEMCWSRARSMYGDELPKLVSDRLSKELESIIKHGFAVLYIIAQRLVKFSEDNGYLVGSRGSVGSSFVATMAGISEVNPLPPHYWCPNCRHSEFFTDGSVGSGFDLPNKACPECGTQMNCDGHDIPFETFLGFYGDKSPDIDLNFSGEVQGKVHKYTEELFGAQNVFRAGTLGTLADKTAYGFVMKFLEEKKIKVSRAEVDRLVAGCVGVKRTTGQHPGGIIVVPQEYEVYDFTPVQHPADDPNSNIVTTHFAFSYLHDTILKLDELGHDIPTKYKLLEKFSNMSVMDVPMNDKAVYQLFESTAPLGITPEALGGTKLGTFGLPEFGTAFVQPVVVESKPRTFADLLQVSGLTHGTDVWLGNAQDLINQGICDISKVIGTRDGIMLDLIRYGLPNGVAFKIMESVRKGRGLTPEWIEEMRAHSVPEWYISSCLKIKYMFPKAHAAAYVMSAIRVGWFKVHMPVAFYCAMFTAAVGDFDAEIALSGKSNVFYELQRIKKLGKEASQKEQGMVATLELMNECLARGIKFLPISLERSAAKEFLPENGAIRLPFLSLGGLGETAALRIIEEREKSSFFTVDDLQIRAGLNKSVVEILRKNGVLDDLSDTDQLSFF